MSGWNRYTQFHRVTLLLFSLNGSNALEMFLKLNPRNYKYDAYITVSADVFLLSNMTIVEYENAVAAIAL
jgi:hypothetical protein